MLASSFTDPVLGVDIHFEMVPTPAPVPTPIPNPFTGVVFDPVGLVAGILIGGAISAVLGAPFQGPVFYWTAFPATNTGTEAMHVPGHIIIPPGTAWAPFPKTPKPVIHPGEVPTPGLPVKPEDDAIVIFGSKTVTMMGSNAVRLGDIALSCGEPVRLPSSVVLAVPKGAPILIGGPPSLDILAAIMGSLRTRFISDSLHAALSRLQPSRFRNFLHRAVCFLTGHPVDLATGKVVVDVADVELNGPIPLRITRHYSSAFASRPSIVGRGWSLSVDQAVWEERGQVVYRGRDGREVVFDTFDQPKHRLPEGREIRHPFEALWLQRLSGGRWIIKDARGIRHEFETPRSPPKMYGCSPAAFVSKIVHPSGELVFNRDDTGRLNWLVDAAQRTIEFEHDRHGRLVTIRLPNPNTEGFYPHRRYEYDDAGDLVAVTDALGHRTTYQYVTHLLVRETNRNGESFYFQYDGLGEDAYCVRTWGDGGLFDHAIAYDKQQRVTFVTDSKGAVTQYHLDTIGLVTKVVDPLQGETTHEYDVRHLAPTKTVNPDGSTIEREYDALGRLIRVKAPDGTENRFEYFGRSAVPSRRTDSLGRQWTSELDGSGRVVARRSPHGQITSHRYDDRGLLVRTSDTSGHDVQMHYDGHGLLTGVTPADGERVDVSYDRLGRPTTVSVGGHIRDRIVHDLEGREVGRSRFCVTTRKFAYDPEGNLVEWRAPGKLVRFEYGSYNRICARKEEGIDIRFEWDTEGQLEAVVKDDHITRYERDECGRVVAEHLFSGHVRRFVRDAMGRVLEVVDPSQRKTAVKYAPGGRIASITDADGAVRTFEYREDGALLEATNETGTVVLARDAVGRVVEERSAIGSVTSEYGVDGLRSRYSTDSGVSIGYERTHGRRQMRIYQGRGTDEVLAQIRRDERGAQIAHWAPNAEVRWSRDRDGRPVERTVSSVAKTGQVDRYHWAGQTLAAHDRPEGRREFTYDAAGRLLGRRDGEHEQRRRFDNFDNDYPVDDPQRRFGSGGEILRSFGRELEWNEDGFLVRSTTADGVVTEYNWAGDGTLRGVDRSDGMVARYEYDALGRRIRKRVTQPKQAEVVTDYLWDGGRLLEERKEGEAPVHWVYDPHTRRPVARLQSKKRWTVVACLMGVPTHLVDGKGRAPWVMDLDLRGRGSVRCEEDGPTCPFRWPGQLHDEETGLHYNLHRYYDPQLGTYISPDPLGLAGSINPYSYTTDLLQHHDPDGLAKTCGPGDEQPPDSAVIMLSGKHAAIRVRAGNQFSVTQLLIHEPDEVFERLLRRARSEGPSAYNGAGTKVDFGLGDFAPSQQFVVFFESSDDAARALGRQDELAGSLGKFKLGENSCVTHVEDVLGAGGIPSNHGLMQSPSSGSFAGHVENNLNGIDTWW